MNLTRSTMSGAHRTMLFHELLHAGVVLVVVVCATVITLVKASAVSSDLLSFVYGGALSYAGARAATARQALSRTGDRDAGG